MDGEAGCWTTSGNIGLPPLARVMGVGRQQHYVGVNVFHVCLNFGVVYGVGICIKVCGVVCVVCCLFLTSGCCLSCCDVVLWVCGVL